MLLMMCCRYVVHGSKTYNSENGKKSMKVCLFLLTRSWTSGFLVVALVPTHNSLLSCLTLSINFKASLRQLLVLKTSLQFHLCSLLLVQSPEDLAVNLVGPESCKINYDGMYIMYIHPCPPCVTPSMDCSSYLVGTSSFGPSAA